ncbi:MAG: preprotein translocase subunit SecY [Planctomycetota bacterium]|nr:MAG: preprotein translocase subunit SecY [Planctomycetota bacterium]
MELTDKSSNKQELYRRIVISLLLLVIYRIGCKIPMPGIDTVVLNEFFSDNSEGAVGKVLEMFNMFNGGAFKNMTIFALGIMPYISVSIVLQILTLTVPFFEKISKDGDAGRKKISQYTKYGTVVVCLFQGFAMCSYLASQDVNGSSLILTNKTTFLIMCPIVLTTGSMFLLWLGDIITDKGIGNGVSMIIMLGIIASMPVAIYEIVSNFTLDISASDPKDMPITSLAVLLFLFITMIISVVYVQQGQRRIPIQQAKRSLGSRIYGGVRSDLPLKILSANVIPIILASAVMIVPQALSKLPGLSDYFGTFSTPTTHSYVLVYLALIVFFTFFFTMLQFNPTEVSENLKKGGYFIPGYRPGKKTADYLDWVMLRLTFAGALFLAIVAEVPLIIQGAFNVNFAIASLFGGTGLLIVVGVGLDLLDKIQSYLVVKNYEGIMQTTDKYKTASSPENNN